MSPDPRIPGLLSLLRAHAPSDLREEGFLAEMLALAERSDPFARDHFVPGHFTASAFVSSPDGGSLLLIHHGKLGRWLQPGGHFEPEDDDLFAAVRREVAEEVGLTGLVSEDRLFDIDIHDIPPLKGDPPHRHYDLRVHLQSPTWSFRAGSDARAAKWVALLDVSLEESDESVMRAVRKLTAGTR